MTNIVVMGAQWGDEGKGKIVDCLSELADVVVRYQGGHNAGHTLVVDGKSYKLSLLPSGLVRGKKSIIGNGVVVDPNHFLTELAKLKAEGVAISPANLSIAENCALILSIHKQLDSYREERSAGNKIGTTKRGIGPAYEDKIARRAIRLVDLQDRSSLLSKIERLLDHHNSLRRGYGLDEVKAADIYQELDEIADDILPFMAKSWEILYDAVRGNKKILFEGAQGALLDNDFGTYPFVTSSNTIAAQASLGSGVGMKHIGYVLGIMKAYTTRVGSGVLPTEQDNEIGEYLGSEGKEFGVVTGRKRRCGWLDIVPVRQMVKINAIDGIALMKIDVLDKLEEIKICVAYELDGKQIDYLPDCVMQRQRLKPIYKSVPGWQCSTYGLRDIAAFPKQARDYISYIEELIGVKIAILSTSPERSDTIYLESVF